MSHERVLDRDVNEGCIVCREVAGEIDLPGGLLWEDAEVIAFHLPPTDGNPRAYIGHCMVVTKRHIDHLADLTDQEAESVARASRAVAGALRAEGVERVTSRLSASEAITSISICTRGIPASRPTLGGRLSMNCPTRRTEPPTRSPTS
jgi:hypothetical protein